jgi:hypothetical protein
MKREIDRTEQALKPKPRLVSVILDGPGGELDRQTVTVVRNTPIALSDQIQGVVQTWILSPGDVIRIIDVGCRTPSRGSIMRRTMTDCS